MSLCDCEYEHQFWGFSGKDLSLGLKNVSLETIQTCIEDMYQSFMKRIPEEEWPALHSSCQTLLNECSHKAMEHFKTAEAYIAENFSIPPHILLEEDSVQRQQYSDEERENIESDIKYRWRRINRAHFLEHHLVNMLEKNEELKSISEKVMALSLPQLDGLPSCRELKRLCSETLGLEVLEANCHLKDQDSDESNEYNQPDYALEALKRRRKKIVKQHADVER